MEGSGWVRLYRKSIESQAFQNDSLWKVWTWCIMKANHQDNWVSIQTGRGLSEVHVKRGQFIFGRKAAAKELRMKPSSIRNRMEKLKSMRNVDIQPDTHYSLITIINYDTYNLPQNKEDRQEDKQRTGKGQPKDTNNNEENDKNEKKELFVRFWNLYDKKIARKKCEPKFLKLSLETMDLIFKALNWQIPYWKLSGQVEQFIPNAPNPETYLNQARWEDEKVEIKETPSEGDQIRNM